MSWQNWIVLVMMSLSFINRVMTIFRPGQETNSASLAALVVTMLWFGALVMLLHSGGFW